MTPHHPERDLIAYLLGELGESKSGLIAEHLTLCEDCGQRAEAFRRILTGLERFQPSPPPIHPTRYRQELHERLGARRRKKWQGWSMLLRPIPMTLSAAVIALGVIAFVLQGGLQRGTSRAEFSIAGELLLFQHLEVFRQYSLLDRLDLFEDLEAIRNLNGSEQRDG